MISWNDKWREINDIVEDAKRKLDLSIRRDIGYTRDKIDKLLENVNEAKGQIGYVRQDIQDLRKFIRACQFNKFEEDKDLCDVIIIPYNYFDNEALVIHHGKRIDVSHFNNLTLDWDSDGVPNLTIDK